MSNDPTWQAVGAPLRRRALPLGVGLLAWLVGFYVLTGANAEEIPGVILFGTLFFAVLVAVGLACREFWRLPQRVSEQRNRFLSRAAALGFEPVDLPTELGEFLVVSDPFPRSSGATEAIINHSGVRQSLSVAVQDQGEKRSWIFQWPGPGSDPAPGADEDAAPGFVGAVVELDRDFPPTLVVCGAVGGPWSPHAHSRRDRTKLRRARDLERVLHTKARVWTTDADGLTAAAGQRLPDLVDDSLLGTTIEIRGRLLAVARDDTLGSILADARRLQSGLDSTG